MKDSPKNGLKKIGIIFLAGMSLSAVNLAFAIENQADNEAETKAEVQVESQVEANANNSDQNATPMVEAKQEAANASNASNASSESNARALTQLVDIIKPLDSLQGGFSQKVVNERGKVLHQSQGKMWLKKPGQFRWEILGKDKRTVISDGKKVWDYDPELSQVTITQLSKGKSTAPIFFLTGDADTISNDFEVRSLGQGKCLNGSDQCFELKPKVASSSFLWIKVGFNDNQLKEMEMLDQLGQRSQFAFHNLSMNQVISAKQFRFVPPKGVDVVKN